MDLDRDGVQDVVSANELGNNLTVFLQLSPGISDEALSLTLGGIFSGLNGPVSVAATDLDGDGAPDLISANELGNNLTAFFHRSGSFDGTPSLFIGGAGTMRSPVSIAAEDFDDDGDQDLVSANADPFGNPLTVFFQVSPGRFGEGPLVLDRSETASSPSWVTAADLDGDGDQDLASANGLGDNLTVFFGAR